jgi:hypothetical protein
MPTYNIDDIVAVSNESGKWRIIEYNDETLKYKCIRKAEKGKDILERNVTEEQIVLIKKHTKKVAEQEKELQDIASLDLGEDEPATEELKNISNLEI